MNGDALIRFSVTGFYCQGCKSWKDILFASGGWTWKDKAWRFRCAECLDKEPKC